MFSLVQKGVVKFSTTSIDKLDENLPEGIYYIAHKLVTNKGKLLILKGDIVISRKENIILFLKESIAYEDLRNFLIYPTHDNQQPFVIDVSEDALFNIYR
ncbi:hypothetical protein [Flavobacterium sp. '19STA2R22 D10 B1']|uniref:hypothetical protein n=1 Tax=Flavobacterium aerium TaxID=3037261 RepID=UPI00278BB333|nr:hypothetical protein [Flavobacterium sp. '19STA2R22 D10 B1']